MALAIFDLDHTLIGTDSDHQWLDFLCSKGELDASLMQEVNHRFLQQYQDGTLDLNKYLTFALAPLARLERAYLDQLHQEFMQTRIVPAIYPQALQLIAQHRQAGDHLLVITATNAFVVAPIIQYLNIADFLAIDLETQNGRFTGKPMGELSFGKGKIARLNTWNQSHQFDLSQAYFYSDSINDLPLLECVGTPVATNPCPRLRAIAQERQWQILNFAPAPAL